MSQKHSFEVRGKSKNKILIYLFLTLHPQPQGSTVRAFHSHLQLKIDVRELENVFRSMSANTKQPNLYSSQ